MNDTTDISTSAVESTGRRRREQLSPLLEILDQQSESPQPSERSHRNY